MWVSGDLVRQKSPETLISSKLSNYHFSIILGIEERSETEDMIAKVWQANLMLMHHRLLQTQCDRANIMVSKYLFCCEGMRSHEETS
jgi:hypothetical protein